jgi:CPA2 family monovalent cation:H+ antiporter-2
MMAGLRTGNRIIGERVGTTMNEQPYLHEVLILLVALLVFVPLFQRLRFGEMLGYLAAGVVIGPSVLGLVGSAEETKALAELGVVFLLFSVGLELSPERLRLFGRRTYGLAVAQMVVTTLVLAGCAHLAGLQPTSALAVGGALALSSTAIVLQLLKERGGMTGQLGRAAIAILLVQDFAVAPMLVFVNTAGEPGGKLLGALGISAVKFIIIVTLILLAERILLRPLLRLAADTGAPEVFTGATLLLVLGTGWATDQAGLSMALGAFLAGIMVADTEFRHQVHADIQPFRGLLLGLFFITVGLTLDVGYAGERAGTVALIVVGLIAIKAALVAGLAALFGVPRGRALWLGGFLSQGSEFAFVLLALAAHQGLIVAEHAQLLTVAVGVSMAVTPIGALIARRMLSSREREAPSLLGNLEQERSEISGHVVIAGFGQVGMAVARFLAGERIPVLILDLSTRRVTASRARGLPVFYGNATRIDVLRAAHLDRAHALVVAMPESATAEQVTTVARQSFRDLRIFTRVHDEDWVRKVQMAGADAVVLDGLTTALDLAERVMLFYRPEGTE